MQNTQDKTEDKSGIRSFIVLMDKNQDTQWLEDGEFVDNPMPKPCFRSTSTLSFQDALGIICGIDYVRDASVTTYNDHRVYVVAGNNYSNPNLTIRRNVVVHYQ